MALLFACSCSFSVAPATSGDDAGTDAPRDVRADAPADATFDLQTCPTSYASITNGETRYRVILSAASFWMHSASCDADSSTGTTHAAVLDTLAEAAAVRAHLVSLSPTLRTFGVGVVQSPSATMVDEGWVDFHDQPVSPALWGIFGGIQQPDDGGVPSTEADHLQNVAFLDVDATGPSPYLRDGNGNGAYVFVCECDGKPVGPLSRSYVAGDINRPTAPMP